MNWRTVKRYRIEERNAPQAANEPSWAYTTSAEDFGRMWADHGGWDEVLRAFRSAECCTGTEADLAEGHYGSPAAVHFVGFRGDEYARAVAVFGRPNFIHRNADVRLYRGGELAPHDTVVFANGAELRCSLHAHNDSECM